MLEIRGLERSGPRPYKTRVGIAYPDDPRGSIVLSGTDGEVVSSRLNRLVDTNADFSSAEEGFLLKVGTNYYTITRVVTANTRVHLSEDLTAGTSIAWSIVDPSMTDTAVDLTDCESGVLWVSFAGACTGCSVQLEVKVGTSYYTLGTPHALTGSPHKGAAVRFDHGGSFVRATITAIAGVVDPSADFVTVTVRGGPALRG